MTPILTGIVASGISGHLTPPWAPEGAYDSLYSVTVPSGGAASIIFDNIPSGYKHLQLRVSAKIATSSYDDSYIRFNNVSNGSYVYYHQMVGQGTTPATGSSDVSTDTKAVGHYMAGNDRADVFNAGITDIYDYSSSTKNKTLMTLTGVSKSGSGIMLLRSALFKSTAPITSIELFPASTTFTQYSHFALYGVK